MKGFDRHRALTRVLHPPYPAHRFADFVVQELDVQRNRVQLTELVAPPEPKRPQESSDTASPPTVEHGLAFLLTEKLCDVADVDKLRKLVTACGTGANAVAVDQKQPGNHGVDDEDGVVVLAVRSASICHAVPRFISSGQNLLTWAFFASFFASARMHACVDASPTPTRLPARACTRPFVSTSPASRAIQPVHLALVSPRGVLLRRRRTSRSVCAAAAANAAVGVTAVSATGMTPAEAAKEPSARNLTPAVSRKTTVGRRIEGSSCSLSCAKKAR
jgi:hypothetical protein